MPVPLPPGSIAHAFRRLRRLPALAAGGLGALLMVLAGHCGASYTSPTLDGPEIISFTAARPAISTGGSTQLTAVFANGLGMITPNVGPVLSNVPVTVAPLVSTRYVLTVSPASGAFVQGTVEVEVDPAPAVPVITLSDPAVPGSSLTQLVPGQSYTASVPDQPGCTFAWTIHDGSPATATGTTISFTAAAYGVLTLTCTATNRAGASTPSLQPPVQYQLGGPEILSFTATTPVLTGTEPAAPATLAYRFSGGTGKLSSPGSADIPLGGDTSNNPTTGTVTVTPPVTPGATSTATYTLTVTDGTEVFSQDVTVTVVPAPSIYTFSATAFILGTGGSTAFTAAFDGSRGETAVVEPGAIALDNGKTSQPIEGVEHTTTYTLTVTNAAGATATRALTVLVGTLAPYAGGPSGEGSPVGSGSAGRYVSPAGVAYDLLPNADGSTSLVLLVADAANHVIHKLTASGPVWTLSTLAGLEGVPGSADSTVDSPDLARFDRPMAVAVDPVTHNLWVADAGNDDIRVVTPAGFVSTVAGVAGHPGSADAGLGPDASFNHPAGIALDLADNLVFVADTGNATIREIQLVQGDTAGAVSTLCGVAGVTGSTDGASAAAGAVPDGTALFSAPAGLVWDADITTSLYVADPGNNNIRAVTLQGVASTVAGAPGLFPAGPMPSGTLDGDGTAARFFPPQALALGGAGDLLYVADAGNSTIRTLTLRDGNFTAATLAGVPGVAGRSDGAPGAAEFDLPLGLAVDPAGNVFVADTGNATIRMLSVAAPAQVATLSGKPGDQGLVDSGAPGTPGLGEPGGTALFRHPLGAATDASGNLYVADSGNQAIRMMTPAGTVSTLAGGVRNPDGGSPLPGYLDGPAVQALFSNPSSVAVALTGAGAGTVYVADPGNQVIRAISGGQVATPPGMGLHGQSGWADSPDGLTTFDNPSGLAVDGAGNLYVADTGNNTIRKLTPPVPPDTVWASTTLAGTAGTTGALDGVGAAASFTGPAALAVTRDGRTVYVADTGNHTIRMIQIDDSGAGTVSTLAGTALLAGTVDQNGTEARLDEPVAIALDGSGNLFVANAGSSTVCVITPLRDVTTILGSATDSEDAAAGSPPAPLPSTVSPPNGLALDPITSDIYITVDDAVMRVDFHG